MCKFVLVIFVSTFFQVNQVTSDYLWHQTDSFICGWKESQRRLCTDRNIQKNCGNDLHLFVCDPFNALDRKMSQNEFRLDSEFYKIYTKDDLCLTKKCKTSADSKMAELTIIFNIPKVMFGIIISKKADRFKNNMSEMYNAAARRKQRGKKACTKLKFPSDHCTDVATMRAVGSSEFFVNLLQFVSQDDEEAYFDMETCGGETTYCQIIHDLVNKIQSMSDELVIG